MSFGKPNLGPLKGFDKFPRWVVKDSGFLKLDELACKLLVYFAHVRGWKGDTTPWTTIEELAERVGASWRRTNRALLDLGALGVIRTETKRRQKRFKIMYASPHDHTQEIETAGRAPLPHLARRTATPTTNEPATTTASPTSTRFKPWLRQTATAKKIDVHLDVSVEGRSPSELYAELTDNRDRFSTQDCRKTQASQDSEPAWLTEHDEPEEPAGDYVAGMDAELLSPSERGFPQISRAE